MDCCCKSIPCRSKRASAICLGRCDLPKHRCLDREEIKPGPVPKYMGWHYTARHAPEHQLRCGWRPGHISCSVLKKIEQHNCNKDGECISCRSSCNRPPGSRPCCAPRCGPVGTISKTSDSEPKDQKDHQEKKDHQDKKDQKDKKDGKDQNEQREQPSQKDPLIRIIRHDGKYTICTKPSSVSNAPSGPYPLKYVLDTDNEQPKNAKYSVEAKFNDYHFDYTSSQASFIVDFSPPSTRCYKPCPKKSIICMLCKTQSNNWPLK